MEPIRDMTWMAQLAFGTLERFRLNTWEAIAVSGEKRVAASHTGNTYRYRLLFFEGQNRHPVYAVNLERTILGDWMLSEQAGPEHRVLERLQGPLSYEQFRIKALEHALTII